MSNPQHEAEATIRFLVSAANEAATLSLRWELVKGDLPDPPPVELADAWSRWQTLAPLVHPTQMLASNHLGTVEASMDATGDPDWPRFIADGRDVVLEVSRMWLEVSECLDAFEAYVSARDAPGDA